MDSFEQTHISTAVPPLPEAELSSRPVRLAIAGFYRQMNQHLVRNRQLNEWILLLCTDGRGWAARGDEAAFPVERGQMVLLSPDQPHSYGNREGETWSLLWLHCTGAGVSALAGRAAQSGAFPAPPQAFELMRQILDEVRAGQQTTRVLYAESMLTRLLALIGHLPDHAVSPAVLQAQQLLQDLAHPLDLDSLARATGMSKYYLRHQYRRFTGETPMEYRSRLRLAKACDLLADPQKTLAAISEELGYSSPYHLSSAFKARYGISPSAYRRLL